MDFQSSGLLKLSLFVLLIKVSLNDANDVLDVQQQSRASPQKAKITKDDGLCTKQARLLLDDYQSKELWALKVFDAWGKSQSGLFSGNLINFGHYEQCLQMKKAFDDPEDGVFQGQHCMIFYQDAPELVNVTSDAIDLILPQNTHIELMRQYMNFHKVRVGTAICLPSYCSSTLVRNYADKMLAVNSMRTTDDYDQESFCNTINILEMRSIDLFAAYVL